MSVRLSTVDPRPLQAFSDGALLVELHARGRLRELYAQTAIDMIEFEALRNADGYLEHIRNVRGQMLAAKILEGGLVQEKERTDDLIGTKMFQMRLLVVTVPSSPTE